MIYLKIRSLINNSETADLFTKNDLFIEIEYGDNNRKTTTLWNTNAPIWNEIFLFSKTDIKKMTLKIKGKTLLNFVHDICIKNKNISFNK